MESRKNPVEEVEDLSLLDVLISPKELTNMLVMPFYSQGRRIFLEHEAVLGALKAQAALGKRKHNKTWLRRMAAEAVNVIGVDRQWVRKIFGYGPSAGYTQRQAISLTSVSSSEEENHTKYKGREDTVRESVWPEPTATIGSYQEEDTVRESVWPEPAATIGSYQDEDTVRESVWPNPASTIVSYPDEVLFPPGSFPPLRREGETDPSQSDNHQPETVKEVAPPTRSQVNEGFSPITSKSSLLPFSAVSPRTSPYPSPRRSERAEQSGNVSSSSDVSPKRGWQGSLAQKEKNVAAPVSTLEVTKSTTGRVLAIRTGKSQSTSRSTKVPTQVFVNSNQRVSSFSNPSRGRRQSSLSFTVTSSSADSSTDSRRRRGSPSPSQRFRETAPSEPKKRKYSKNKGRKYQRCPIPGCNEQTSYPKLHLVEEHIPCVFSEKLEPTDEVTQRRYACLMSMAKCLLGSQASLLDLQRYLNGPSFSFEGWSIIPQQEESTRKLCQSMNWKIPLSFTLEPLNSPAVLLHWRCLSAIANLMTSSARDELRAAFNSRPAPISEEDLEEEEDMTTMRPLVFAFDSHFHLDRLARSLKVKTNGSVAKALEKMPIQESDDYIVQVSGGVVNYCDPETYPSGQELEQLVSDGYRVAVGIHPKKIASEEQLKRLEGLLRSSAVVGLGEVGLDHSVKDPDSWYRQEEQLRRILPLVSPEKVLVLHIRGVEGDSTGLECYMRCKDILSEYLAMNQPIQLHCFSGSSEVVSKWLRTFPNTCFSFSGLVAHFNQAQRDALRMVPEKQLLLETDAPYFPVHPQYHCSAPHLLDHVARLVVGVRKEQTVEEMLEVAECNARRFFKC